MAWRLSRAVLRCQGRRAQSALRAAPLPGALIVAAVVAAPFSLWRIGQALGSTLRPALEDVEIARLLTLGPVVAGATAGAAACLTSAGRLSLGPQIAALPVGPRASLTATVLVPAWVLLALGLPAALALAVPLGIASAGGAMAGIGLIAGGLAGAGAGAAGAECVLQAWAGERRRGFLALLGLSAAWTGVGLLAGSAALGPPALVAMALAGDVDAAMALTCVAMAAILGGAAWLELASRRPERPVAHPSALVRRVRGPVGTALPLAALVLLTRRRDLRIGALASVGFGVGGVLLARELGLPAPGPLQLGASSALLGVALAPLAVGGTVSAGRWIWVCAPWTRVLPCAVFVAAAHVVLVVALMPVVAAAVLASGVPVRGLAEVGFVAVLLAAAAVLAGALVPWRGATMGDQITSFGAFAVCAGLLSAAAGVAGPRLVSAGLPDAAAAACVLAAGVALGLGAVVRRLLGAS